MRSHRTLTCMIGMSMMISDVRRRGMPGLLHVPVRVPAASEIVQSRLLRGRRRLLAGQPGHGSRHLLQSGSKLIASRTSRSVCYAVVSTPFSSYCLLSERDRNKNHQSQGEILINGVMLLFSTKFYAMGWILSSITK